MKLIALAVAAIVLITLATNTTTAWMAQARRERNGVEAATAQGLAPLVGMVAAAGSISQLWCLVFEPIRVASPCGATIIQGQTFRSLGVELSDYDAETDATRRCEA
jgi:hypothetical protein